MQPPMAEFGWYTIFTIIGVVALAALMARILLDGMSRSRQAARRRKGERP